MVAKRKRGVKRTPLEMLEELADERFGAGSSISVDRIPGGYAVTAWRPNGDFGARGSSLVRGGTGTKVEAIAILRMMLSDTTGRFMPLEGGTP